MEKPTDDSSNADTVSDSEIVITCEAKRGGEGVEKSTSDAKLSHIEREQGLPQFDGGLGLERVCNELSAEFPQIENLTETSFAPGDRVLTCAGTGIVERYHAGFKQYEVSFRAAPNGFFQAKQMKLIE